MGPRRDQCQPQPQPVAGLQPAGPDDLAEGDGGGEIGLAGAGRVAVAPGERGRQHRERLGHPASGPDWPAASAASR